MNKKEFQEQYRNQFFIDEGSAASLALHINENDPIEDDEIIAVEIEAEGRWVITLASAYNALAESMEDIDDSYPQEDYVKIKNESAGGLAAASLLIEFIHDYNPYMCRVCKSKMSDELTALQHVVMAHDFELGFVLRNIDRLCEQGFPPKPYFIEEKDFVEEVPKSRS